MSKWEEKKFKEFIKLNRGFDLPNDKIKFGNYPVVASTNIKGYHISYKVTAPVVVTGRSGSLGVVQYIDKNCTPLNTTLYVKDFKGNFPRFVYYYLKTMRLDTFNSGAGVPTLNQNHLHSIKINIPDLPTQERIADILSAYDDLIEANNRRIELLEQVAQELYKEWFVRFRFPGHEKAKFENGLPEGWRIGKFKDELNYNTGKLDSNTSSEDGKYSFYTCAKTVYKTNTYCFDGECVLLGGNNATGDFSLFYANEKLDAYQRTYIVTPQNPLLSCVYIYFVLKNYLLQFKTSSIGATTKFLTKGMLDKAKIIIPDTNILLWYNELSQNMFKQITLLKARNENLTAQRDLLLPRLMGGKLEV